MEITLEDAKTIAMALVQLNNVLVQEYEKIDNTPDVSEFVRQAAYADYNNKTRAGTELHVKLCQAFPELTAGQAVSL